MTMSNSHPRSAISRKAGILAVSVMLVSGCDTMIKQHQTEEERIENLKSLDPVGYEVERRQQVEEQQRDYDRSQGQLNRVK
jgi:hypothetical protein